MLNLFSAKIDAFSDMLGKILGWFAIAVVILMASTVLLRYGFNLGSIALQESVIYLHAIVLLFGAGFTLKHNEHVRVDLFYTRFSAVKKAWVNLLGGLFLLLPVNIFIIVMSWSFVMDSWAIMESSSESGGLPFLYLLKTCIPVFAVFLLLQGISEMIKAWLVIVNGKAVNSQANPASFNSKQINKGEE